MVISRSDIKRKRKDSGAALDILPESPKRTKVHAQRKFAQGSNVNSPVITPVKEIEREKVKCNEVIQPAAELLPTKRPNTEDFLTFLCFRGTKLLPPSLNFFNNSSSTQIQSESNMSNEFPKSSASVSGPETVNEEKSDRPFIAFGVRKRADPFINNKMEKKRRHALALQALRRKYQEQRLAKIRAVTIEKQAEAEGIKKKNITLRTTRSIARQVATKPTTKLKKVSTKCTKRVIISRSPVKRPTLKQKMCLRSKGRFILRELAAPIKKRPIKIKKNVKISSPMKTAKNSSSEFSSDDDEPLVKTIKKPVVKVAPKIVRIVKNSTITTTKIRLTRSSQPLEQLEVMNNKITGNRKQEKHKPLSKHVDSVSQSQRPPRKTKEAATVYMELLGRKLVNAAEIDDDDASIDSFPELPNVRRTEQRENEMKANVKQPINTRKFTNTKEKMDITPIDKANKKLPDSTKEKTEDKCGEKKEELRNLRSRPERLSKPEINVDTIDPSKAEFNDSDEEPLAKLTKLKKPSKLIKKVVAVDKKIAIVVKKKIKLAKVNKPILEKKVITDTKTDQQKFDSKVDKKKLLEKVENKIIADKKIETKSNKRISDVLEKKGTDKKCDKQIVDQENKPIMKKKVTEPTLLTETKVEQKISLSDDEGAFRGFVIKTESSVINKKSVAVPRQEIPVPARLFGKEKVNMSTEQIQQWLKDSAIAGETKDVYEKKYDEDLIKFEEKINCKLENPKIEEGKTFNLPFNTAKTKVEKIETIKNIETTKTAIVTPAKIEKMQTPIERKYIFQQRRSLLNKDRKDSPNTKAFSPENESSVYAFEAETESSPINTPFRSNVRRPSSTATSRSEEDTSKLEDDGKFRLPAVLRPTTIRKQELSLTLSPDDTNSASIAVQVNLDSDTVFSENNVSLECSTQTDVGDDEGDGHLFYIPLQPGKQSVTNQQQVIQGVALKLGTAGGSNQRVVMHAKLVTQPPQKPLAQSSTLMYPPVGTVQPTYRSKPFADSFKPTDSKSVGDNSSYADSKTVPSSPSASSSSSAKIYKRTVKPRARSLDFCVPIYAAEFPKIGAPPQLVEAPTFHPTEKEFQDPLEFIQKIKPCAEKFGICRIIPPANFKPECKVSDDMRFTAYNQYVNKLLHRWGPNFKEFMAIKKYLATQSINLIHPPWIGGMEIDLPRLYQTVQSLGGLKEVIEKKRWPKVAEGMKIPKSAQDRVTKLDDIYCKYLLPYDTLSPAEREKLFEEVETEWAKRESRSMHRTQQSTTNVSANSNESDSESGEETEECTVKGRNMALNAFYRIARNTMSMWFKSPEPIAQEVEQEFWKHVTTKQNHICVHSGSIDSSGWGYGFACSKNSPFARHPWNLKILTNNSGSLLRSLGPVMGVTVPTLHVGMVFTSCCWYRDPHGLPWIEYLHTGANKIWYGIPDSYSDVFRSALTKLVPSYCRSKTLWLTSDTAMVPPSLLVKNGVSLCRTVQEPGQFIVVFPKAFTSSICSGYVVSESVYFAPSNWLTTAHQTFKDIRDSCESSMFSLDRLLLSIASDTRSNSDVLRQILPAVEELRERENLGRTFLESLGLKTTERLPLPDISNPRKKRKMQEDGGEYECEICRTNLFVSLVIDSQEEGVYCLDHAKDHIKDKPEMLKRCKLLFTYGMEDLNNLIEKMRLNIETKAYVKKPSKFAGRATLLK